MTLVKPKTPAEEFAALKEMRAQLAPWLARGADGKIQQLSQPKPSVSQLWVSENSAKIADAAYAFYLAHPTDLERWEAAAMVVGSPTSRIAGFQPGHDEAMGAKEFAKAADLVIYDEAAGNAAEARYQALSATLLAAPDAPEEAVAMALWGALTRALHQPGLTDAQKAAAAEPWLAQLEARAPGSKLLLGAYSQVHTLLKGLDPDRAWELVQRAKAGQSEFGRKWADGELSVESAKTAPMELAFTALDGRSVDLAQMRGKVVLVQFWATWCGPCKAEIPSLLSAYEQFKAEGFEVVGISLDNDQAKLTAYIQEKQIPWPNFFDGSGWDTSVAGRFGVRSIPTFFLLDRSGRIGAVSPRGEKLHSEIRRLLSA